jgi:hypothetical protein
MKSPFMPRPGAYLALIEEVPRPFRENARIGFRTNA